MTCDDIQPYLDAFIDDELSPERTLDVKRHLRQCSACLTEVQAVEAMVTATRTSVNEAPMCPDFRSRLEQCLAEERKRQEHGVWHHPLGYRVILPVAAAAAMALGYGWYQQSGPGQTGQPVIASSDTNLVDLLVNHHTRPPTPSVTDTSSVTRLEPKLGFPVHAPNLERYGARFVGASLVSVNGAAAALLHYDIRGRRLTFYVYNPEELPLRAIRALHPRVVGNQAVFVGHRRGYSIATCERQGVGYALAADLSDEESAKLVAAVDGH